MSSDKEKMWSAYLDGELSTSEAAAFDESLSQREGERLASELRLEHAIGDTLAQSTRCPDLVWARVQAQLHATSRSTIRTPHWSTRILAAAACLAMLFGAGWAFARLNNAPHFLDMPASVPELALNAEWRDSWEHVQEYLEGYDVHLALRPLDSDELDLHDSIRFVGAARQRYHGEDVIELMFDCCKRPIMLTLVPKQSDAATKIAESVGVGDVRETRVVGDYMVAYVGHHPAYGLMDIFAEI